MTIELTLPLSFMFIIMTYVIYKILQFIMKKDHPQPISFSAYAKERKRQIIEIEADPDAVIIPPHQAAMEKTMLEAHEERIRMDKLRDVTNLGW